MDMLVLQPLFYYYRVIEGHFLPTHLPFITISWPSKTDSAPVRGDGYEPGSSKFRLRANAETSYSSAIGPSGGGCERCGR